MTRKASKYKPKLVNRQAHAMVVERVTPIRNSTAAMAAVRIQNHMALNNLRMGQGSRDDVRNLVIALNTSVALPLVAPRLGSDWLPEVKAALGYLCDMIERGVKHGDRFVFKAQELSAINLAMDIHDAQLDECYGAEMEAAIAFSRRALQLGAMKKNPLGE